jgi:serine/threonine protein kinase
MILFSCSCGQKFKVKPDFAGRKTTCPACKQPLVVPTFDSTQAIVPKDQIDGTPSSIVQAGMDGGVTLEQATRPGQKPVKDLLARRGKSKERYFIEGEIARGGMGAVLRAVDCDIRREVAVKYLLDQADPKKKQRFIEEAQITGQLEHPNIPPVHELGADKEKRLFFSMKMVKGRSLAQVLDELHQNPRAAEREWTLGRLLNIFVNVCNGLAYAHSRGVVHRDLKPANIMVGDFGEVYVMDWGLAKVLKGGQASELPQAAGSVLPSQTVSLKQSSKVETSREVEADLTQEGSVLGTPVYMPPEQASGNLHAIDQRSDIYSLGAILYEMLTLQPPVNKEAGYLAILMRVMEGEIVPPEQRTPKRVIPKELSAIAMKALAKNPANRYPTVENLRKDIERFHEGRSVSAKEDTFKEMAWKLVKRNKVPSGFTTVLAVVLAWGLVAHWFAQRKIDQANAAAQAQQKELIDRTRNAVPALVVAARQVANSANFKDAHKQVDLALAYEPRDADAHLLKGQLLLGRKDWTEAKAELEQYLEQKNDADVKTLLDLCKTGKANDPATQYAVADILQRQNVPGPAIPLLQEVEQERKKREPLLPVYQKQIDVNWQGLGKRLSLGPDGLFGLNFHECRQVTTLEPLKGMPLSWLSLNSCDRVRDLTPLKGMALVRLDLNECPVQDLTPLRWMPLKSLFLNRCGEIQDLTPLKGLPLTHLELYGCPQVMDLTPLQGLSLKTLNLFGCQQVQDLTPLRGMPLTWLSVVNTHVTDLTPLQGMNLTEMYVSPRSIINGMSVLRAMKSLKKIGYNQFDARAIFTPEEFWKKYDAGEFK